MGAYDQFLKETKRTGAQPAAPVVTPPKKEGVLKTVARVLLPKVAEEALGFNKPDTPAETAKAAVATTTSAFERFKQETSGKKPVTTGTASPAAPVLPDEAQRVSQAEAVKQVASAQLGRLQTDIQAATAARDTKLATLPKDLLGQPIDKKAAFETEQTLKNLEVARNAYTKALEHDDAKGGFFADVWEGVKTALEEPAKLVPFLGSAASVEESFGAYKAFEKQKKGETLTPYENSLIEKFKAKSLPTEKELGYMVGSTIAQLPTFALEFAMTAGVFSGVKVIALKGITKGIETVAPKLVIKAGVASIEGVTKKQTAVKLASEITAAAIAGTAQGSVNVPAIANKTLNYMLPSYEIVATADGDKLEQAISKNGDSFGTAFAKAFGTNTLDYVTERTGVVVEKPLELLQRATLGKWLQNRGIKEAGAAYKLLSAANKTKELIAWNGIIGEVFEEELANLGQAPIEGQSINLPLLTPEGTERLLVETLAIGAFGGIGKISDATLRAIAGKRSGEDKNPEVKISTTAEKKSADLQKEIEKQQQAAAPETKTELVVPPKVGGEVPPVKTPEPLKIESLPITEKAQQTLDGIKQSKQDFNTELALQYANKIAAIAGGKEITPSYILEAAQYVYTKKEDVNQVRTSALFQKGGGGLENYKRAEQIGITELLDTEVPALASKAQTAILKLDKRASDTFEGWINRILLTPEAKGYLTRADLERVNAVLTRAASIRKKYNEATVSPAIILQALQEVGGKKPTQKEKVKKAVEGEAKTIKEVSRETGILEPNVRRILGVGEKEGEFERVEKGVYILKKDGKDIAFIQTGDAVESLPKLAAEGFKADMVFLDIPYDTPAVKGGSRGVKYDLLSVEQFKVVMDAVAKIVKDDKTPLLYMYSQAVSGEKEMARYNKTVLDAGFKPIAKGELQKLFQNGLPVTNVRGVQAKPEGILLLTKSGEFDKKDINLDFRLTRPKGYQTEKPEEMMKALIESTTEEGDTVLDPFAGSGVTGAAAVKSGRKVRLIEKNKDVVEQFTLPRVKAALETTGTLPVLGDKEVDFYVYTRADRYDGKDIPASFNKVKGRPVDILGYDFFVHRPVRTERGKVVSSDKGWIVTDGYTGRSVTNESYPTQAKAIEGAKERLAVAEKVKKLDEHIVDAIRATGLSPRYAEQPEAAPKLKGSALADIGAFRDGEKYKLHEKLVRPIQFPEMVRLANDLMGDYPKVVENFRKEGKRGDFMPLGNGRIRLLGSLFERSNLHQLSATLAHEIGHLVDYLPEKTLARGNLLGRLKVLSDFNKDFLSGETRTNKQLNEQMYALSKWWRPYDERTADASFIKYRKSAVEIYADFISALFNDPFKTQDIAPSAYNLFFAELDKKPAVRDAYFELQALLTHRPSLIAARQASVKQMFEDAELTAKERQLKFAADQEAEQKSIWFRFKNSFIDKNESFRELVAAAKKEGRAVNDDDNPVYYLEEYNYLGGKMKAEIETKFNGIYKDLQKENLSWEDLGQLMFFERVLLGDRGEVANPLGLQPDFVQELYEDLGTVKEGQNAQHEKGLADMKTVLGAEKFDFLKQKAVEYRQNLKEVFEEGYAEGLYSDSLKDMLQSNDFYVPFRPIKYADQRSSFTVKKQKGTLQPIENPANTGIKKAIAIIRAIERNKVKRAAIQFLQKESPEVVEEPKTVFDGKRQVFLEPKEKDLRLVTYMEGGKVEGFYINDPYIGDSLLLNTVSQSNIALEGLRFANSRFFRPLFITFNLGFQSFKLVRDFWRFWKNVPNVTLWRTINLYGKSFRAAKIRAFGLKENAGERDKEAFRLIESMEADKILSLTFNDILKGEDIEDREIDRIMQHVGAQEMNPQGWEKVPALRPVYETLEFIEKLGNLIETLPKVAGKYELEGKLPPKEMRSFIRRYVGSPDFLAGGTSKKWSNEVFLFSNAIAQGIRSDYEIASSPKTAFGWWWKTAVVNLVPKIIMQGALLGLLGEALKEMLGDVSEYDKTNYIIIPLGKDQNNKTMYVRIPQDETGRFVSGIFWKFMNIVREPKKALSLDSYLQVLSYTGGQLPSISPVIENLEATAQFIAGQNPYDAFRGRNVLTDDQQAAGGLQRVKPFAFWVFENMGGGIFVKLYSQEQQTVPRERTLGERIINAPAIANILGRWVKVSSYGQTEQLRAKTNELRAEKASERIIQKEKVWQYVQESQGKSPAETRAIQQKLIADVIGKVDTKEKSKAAKTLADRFRLLRLRGSADARVDSIITAQSNDEKALLIQTYEDTMSAADFKELKTFLLREKLITPDVLQKVQAAK